MGTLGGKGLKMRTCGSLGQPAARISVILGTNSLGYYQSYS